VFGITGVLFHTFYYYWAEECGSLYGGSTAVLFVQSCLIWEQFGAIGSIEFD